MVRKVGMLGVSAKVNDGACEDCRWTVSVQTDANGSADGSVRTVLTLRSHASWRPVVQIDPNSPGVEFEELKITVNGGMESEGFLRALRFATAGLEKLMFIDEDLATSEEPRLA